MSFTFDWFSSNVPVLEQFVPRSAKRVLEIGSFEGRSTLWFMQHAPDCNIVCIDHFLGGADHGALDLTGLFGRFVDNIEGYEARVTLHKADCWDVLCTLTKESFDVVFVDGSHQPHDVLHDAVEAFRLVKVGGIIILDDYGWGVDGQTRPREAIDAFCACFESKLGVLHTGYMRIVMKTMPC